MVLSGNGYPKLFGLSRGKKFPYQAPLAARTPPNIPQHASKAHFAGTSRVFDPVEIMSKQAYAKAVAFAQMTGNPLPTPVGPTRGVYQVEADVS